MSALSTPLVVLVFLAGVAATWAAGGILSKSTDALDARLGLGEEIGGIVLLAIAGSLPELAITVSAAAGGHLGLAAGNLIGGIAVQTMVLVICDAVAGRRRPLTFLVGALTPVLEGMLVVLVVSVVLMGALLKPSTAIGGVVSPASLAIVIVWVMGVYVINRVRKDPRWNVSMPGSKPGRHRRQAVAEPTHPYAQKSTARVAGFFLAACGVTLVAGVVLELSGTVLAARANVDGVIFGGNAFQVCLFVLADLVAGAPVLPTTGRLNSWLASLGVGLTAIYSIGVVARPSRCRARLGPDSILAIAVFALGVAGLFVIPP